MSDDQQSSDKDAAVRHLIRQSVVCFAREAIDTGGLDRVAVVYGIRDAVHDLRDDALAEIEPRGNG